MTKEDKAILALLRIAISGKAGDIPDVDWSVVINKATEQGVLGITFDAIDLLPSEQRPDIDNLMEWLGQVEYQKTLYDEHKKAISELAKFYHDNGIQMMLMKGYGLSLYWPTPEHRPVGDIDIYLGHLWQFGDQLVRDKLSIEVEDSHEHHTTFPYNGILVENHYDFINTKANKEAKHIEDKLKQLASSEPKKVKIGIEGKESELILPSADFNAIFLMRHQGQHFAGSEITLRQVLDWGFFMQHEHDNITWTEILPFLKEIGLWKFFNQINAICVDYLGFEDRIFPEISRDAKLEARILNDIFEPEAAEIDKTKSTINVIGQKTLRFFRNSWKRKLVYKESLMSQLWYGSIAHLRRFDTIKD